MSQLAEVSVYVLIDADGSYWADAEQSTLNELAEKDGYMHPTRMIELKLTVPVPQQVTLTADIPAEKIPERPVTLTVK